MSLFKKKTESRRKIGTSTETSEKKTKKSEAKTTAAPESTQAPKSSASASSRMLHSTSHLTLRKPHVTEKTLQMAEQNTYVFIAPQNISKLEAAKQIEKLYNVKCMRVRSAAGTQKSRLWRGRSGKTNTYKKIHVTLKKGQKIELTGQT